MQKVNFQYEILVGDDASTDETQQILQEYEQKCPDLFKLILREHNIGATRNIYDVLIKARGKYLATLEGDDYWTDQSKLQKQFELLENHQQYIGCTHKFTIVNHKSIETKKQKLSWVKQKAVFTINDFKGILLPGQLSTWFFRNIFSSGKYKEIQNVHRLISDRTIMMIILLNGDFALIDKNMGCYRMFMELKNKTKCTNLFYINNIDKVRQEINITKKNENIAWIYFKKKYQFLEYRRQIFVDSIIMFLKHPNKRTLHDVKYAFDYSENKQMALYCIIFHVIKKIYYKF